MSASRWSLGGGAWCRRFAVAIAAFAALTAGCDEKKEGAPAEKAVASASASIVVEPPKPPPDRPPTLTVDESGVMVSGERVVLGNDQASAKLRELLSKHPIEGKSVAIAALRNAKTPHVAELVDAVAARDPSGIVLRTPDRAKKDAELPVVSGKKAGKLDPCTLTAMVLKDRSTASWPLRGGGALKYGKGMAGPNLSMTLEGVRRQVSSCPSTSAVISADPSVEWGLTFNLATTLLRASPPLKATTLVLPREEPVAGRAVKLD